MRGEVDARVSILSSYCDEDNNNLSPESKDLEY